MTRAAKKALRRSRAAKQAENYAVNKYIRELKQSLDVSEEEINQLKDELKQVKQTLKQTIRELKKAKASNQKIKTNLSSIARAGRSWIQTSKQMQDIRRRAVTKGSFDSYGYTKGWKYSAQKAGNRLEHQYPGFYAAMKEVEAKGGNPLEMIISYYNISTHKAEIYEMDVEHVVDADYQLLGYVCYQLYQVVLPGYSGIDNPAALREDSNMDKNKDLISKSLALQLAQGIQEYESKSEEQKRADSAAFQKWLEDIGYFNG